MQSSWERSSCSFLRTPPSMRPEKSASRRSSRRPGSNMRKRSRAIEGLPRVRARLSASALRGNYRAIAAQVPGLRIIPMIKADAYGHGAVWAARELLKLPRLCGFGVATLEEGLELRRVAKVPASVPVMIFSGITPYTEDRGALCVREGLVPVFSSLEDWNRFTKGK